MLRQLADQGDLVPLQIAIDPQREQTLLIGRQGFPQAGKDVLHSSSQVWPGGGAHSRDELVELLTGR
jgi:hypothetical protein